MIGTKSFISWLIPVIIGTQTVLYFWLLPVMIGTTRSLFLVITGFDRNKEFYFLVNTGYYRNTPELL